MPPQDLTTLTAFALGLITCALVLSAGLALLGTGYTIAAREIRKLKAMALKSLMAAAVTGAAAILISTSF